VLVLIDVVQKNEEKNKRIDIFVYTVYTVRTQYNESSSLIVLIHYNEDLKKQVFLDISI